MNVLIVHAHPEPASFCSALCQAAAEHFRGLGASVEVSDLHAMGFDPVASERDFTERADADYLVYALEQRNAVKHGLLQPDIQAEIDKVRRCDLLILSFPVYWYSMPALLKGWIDRVFVSGLFYGGRRIFDQGGMRGKRALVCATLGGRERMFSAEGIHDDLRELFRPLLKGTLGYTGFDVLEPFFAYHVPYLDDAARGAILGDWRQRLAGIDGQAPLEMPVTGDYDAHFEARIR
ncbi:NAD(P)H quinone oxidoreductase [Pseudomonas tohonis]|uniref:NAD(P)H quinone oxidoreductase n=1 Tax=Pseudomonas tohonis TaxID=2725477 RepID=A0A6J4E598_9PSED|nr:NAD(P)H-dependent oxidoreductase [Pseudomonas tohonis]UXY55518.1 NAD(P)H-dependent oxidoreductase [Pseudomonas tohonis]BCG24575.1 NAD(P)H quinone oxidoreductase [Pseudomonas tohonis]GJN52066.1 NAD(P)H quinone oxidoreductase [Pseudomonas tohonis]